MSFLANAPICLLQLITDYRVEMEDAETAELYTFVDNLSFDLLDILQYRYPDADELADKERVYNNMLEIYLKDTVKWSRLRKAVLIDDMMRFFKDSLFSGKVTRGIIEWTVDID